MKLKFPDQFLFGTATSAYQIEGGWNADGKGESIWDRFCRIPGAIQTGENGNVACDHYHRWKDDVKLMADLGIQAYRFSTAWTRILPEGRGSVNPAGLDFYSRLVDELLEADITPFLTLYHWDLPQQLEDAGGWPDRSVLPAFREYADVLSRHLGDRVKHWITHNEPWVVAFLGYQTGVFAPGRKNWGDALKTAHHLLVSHGQAVEILRANSPDCQVGITLNLTDVQPASSSNNDRQAARRLDGHINRWFLDPLYRKVYPQDMLDLYSTLQHLPPDFEDCLQPGDLDRAAVDTDFLGVNYYTRAYVSDTDPPGRLPAIDSFQDGAPKTDTGWEIYPEGLTNVLRRLHQEYRVKKLFITENGASFSTGPDDQMRIRDHRRIEYLRDHLQAAGEALDEGIPLAGYFLWTLMDNFEWASGTSQRFGIVWTEFETLERIPKDSAFWYRDVIQHNRSSPGKRTHHDF